MDETTITSSNIPDHRADHTPSPNDSFEVDVIVEAFSQLKMRLEEFRHQFHGEVTLLQAIDSVVNEISDVEAFGLNEIDQTFQPILNPDRSKIRRCLIKSCRTAINLFDVGYKAISARFQSKCFKARNEIEKLLQLLKRYRKKKEVLFKTIIKQKYSNNNL